GFLVILADGIRTRLARYVRFGPDTWKRDFLSGEHASNIYGLAASVDGQVVVYSTSTAQKPPQWYHARVEGTALVKPRAVTKLNEELRTKPHAHTEVFRWKGALGEEVEGLLHYPHDYKKGRKYPLVLMIHGGPFGVDNDAWEETWAYPVNLVAQR